MLASLSDGANDGALRAVLDAPREGAGVEDADLVADQQELVGHCVGAPVRGRSHIGRNDHPVDPVVAVEVGLRDVVVATVRAVMLHALADHGQGSSREGLVAGNAGCPALLDVLGDDLSLGRLDRRLITGG